VKGKWQALNKIDWDMKCLCANGTRGTKQSNEVMNCPFLKRVINIKQNKICMTNVHLWMVMGMKQSDLRHDMSMSEKNNEIGTPNETIERWNVHMWMELWVPNEVSTCEHKGGHLVKQLRNENFKCQKSKGHLTKQI